MTGPNETPWAATSPKPTPQPTAARNGACASSCSLFSKRAWRGGWTLFALLVAACQSPPSVSLDTHRPSDQWDCVAAADGTWDCVQNPAAARAGGNATAAAGVQPRLSVAAHRELAYRPERPTPLLDLPGDYYALQLATRDTPDALERFAEAHRLIGLPQARVARGERVAYVLLAGVYRSRDDAERVRDSLPTRLGSMRPWVRRLQSLQNAMLRANALRGSAASTVYIGGSDGGGAP